MKSLKFLIASICILGMVGMVVGMEVLATETGTVSATVTVKNISVSVIDGAVAYGTLVVSATKDTTVDGVNNTQTATNDGNVTETFNIKSANSTGCVWTLAVAQGSEEYFHKFCNSGTGSPDPCDAEPVWTALTASYQELATGIAASGTSKFDLQIGVPSSTTCYDQATSEVTIQAII